MVNPRLQLDEVAVADVRELSASSTTAGQPGVSAPAAYRDTNVSETSTRRSADLAADSLLALGRGEATGASLVRELSPDRGTHRPTCDEATAKVADSCRNTL